MSWKDWLYAGLGAAAGAASTVFAKWFYKTLKMKKIEAVLGKEETERLKQVIEEFLEKEKEK